MSERPDAPLVSVAVPVATDRAFTYRVPADWPGPPAAGRRVLVPFGSRVLVGVVRPPEAGPRPEKLRDLLADLDDARATLTDELVQLCEWIADYYVAPPGEAYRLALPGLLSNADARTARITEAGTTALLAAGPLLSGGAPPLSTPARRVLETLVEAGPSGLSVARLTRIRPRVPGVLARLAELEAAGLCATEWHDAETSPLRTETHVRRTDLLWGVSADEGRLREIIGRSKRRRALLDYLEGQRESAGADDDEGWVPLAELRGPFARARELLAPLVAADLVAERERPLRLDPFATAPPPDRPQAPTEDQAEALRALCADVDAEAYRSSLLHGITGSGKTEVYLQLIAHVRARGGGAIVLVPEIALTPQLADRFRARFGEEVAVLHSGLTPRQRLDAWQQIRAGERPIAIGARSAVFAPVPRLGVIVVDEEHDASFKQEDGVRYHARDVALVRAKALGVPVVLGSATPALETFALAQADRHRWLRLRTRPTPRPLPQVELVSLAVHRADPTSLLTARMRDEVELAVRQGGQAILFLNRRGFTTDLLCTDCGSRQQCPDCSAPSMTYHLSRHRLMCHLCGHIEAAPQQCRSCGSANLEHGGVGTERVELGLAKALPGLRVLRLDRDAARGRRLLETLDRFRRGQADVLVGTQMLSKGHDFPGVTLVGVLQGDHGLALPDLRAGERTFQLLTQVAGRAGRGERPGRVLVQAWDVEHPAITFASHHDYLGFARDELPRREALGNPPAGYLALVRVQGPEAVAVEARANALARGLRPRIAHVRSAHASADGPPVLAMLGPMPSPIERINRRTRWQLLLRARERAPLRWLLGELRGWLGPEGSGATETLAIVDVDPQSML
ncbi:MAG: primosomal protein N' [Myxococcales bacterium]|nr:primosomal protein N' [Myxococcales bacterium]MCB9716780.1 primosomal protein N' [Myxococcales bacterium]